ncbi:extracellular matrix regulator RemB [Sulfobacillus thermosulfidooxidans]|uniref:extracellular matrix regulator RemB n=1 Tax=Sulfobacillus thermosulfidooxidans TaxID=28034 RepID=UPI00096BB002|nr:extracellular matrix/biofilm biosynthesis regulator RemA family protein [Sulfobacillus thermosulfidooxidans]OLZ08985.1 hypothetical protein BFX05_01920 [Sulfobacillus thermosulfidooxidans]OLZ14171.1 hypothetical protein BFX06_07690 [Sulfobacillus thermosulfidooxidans]OLZ18914.1 hypothetical protein BFX07_04085 [Sulfobacillus thermosulfidooxidans]
MYLHIGHDMMIDAEAIIAILNKNLMDYSPEVRQMIHRFYAEGQLQGDLNDAKSLIFTSNGVILSNISPATLYKRAGRSSSKEGTGLVWYTEI